MNARQIGDCEEVGDAGARLWHDGVARCRPVFESLETK
jgi:hypothetical protein